MHTYDITLPLSSKLPTWPGDPPFVVNRLKEMDAGGSTNTSQISLSVHTGTHVDAPDHFLNNGKTVEDLPLNLLTGRAYVLQVPNEVNLITAAVLEKAEIPPRTRRILFKTRNSEYWKQGLSTFQTDFVALSQDAAQYLVDRGFKLVGVDYLSVAPYQNSRPTHEALLKASVIVIEGLNLSEVSQGRYSLYCLPMKLVGLEGAPVRAILIGV